MTVPAVSVCSSKRSAPDAAVVTSLRCGGAPSKTAADNFKGVRDHGPDTNVVDLYSPWERTRVGFNFSRYTALITPMCFHPKSTAAHTPKVGKFVREAGGSG